jgi:Predicted membrane protein (DUF2079)
MSSRFHPPSLASDRHAHSPAGVSPWADRVVVSAPAAGYAMFIAKSVAIPIDLTWALMLLVWTVAATVMASRLTGSQGGRVLDWLDRHATVIAAALIAGVVLSVGLISVLQARFAAMSVYAEDTAYYSQVLWNTLHGDALSGHVQQARLYDPPVSNDLALHVAPISLGALLLAYVAVPHFMTLVIVRDVALAAAAWPLFLLARQRMGGAAGVAAAALYLGNPVVLAQGFESFTLLHLAALPFFFVFRAFAQGSFWTFLACSVLALGVREDVAIALAGFGVWALVTRRGPRWVAAGFGLPVVWWVVATLAIQPLFQGSGKTVFDVLAGGERSSLGLYGTLLAAPTWITESLQAGGGQVLYGLLRTVGFVPVFGPEGLVALPGVAATLFAARTIHGAGDPLSRFALLPACALVGAAVVIVSRLARRHHGGDPRAFALALLVLLPSVNLLDGARGAVGERLLGYATGHDAAALAEAIAQIPDGAPAAAPIAALPALSQRSRLFTLQYLDHYPAPAPDYVLLDRRVERVWRNPERSQWYAALLNELATSPEYERVWERGDYLVVRRRAQVTR